MSAHSFTCAQTQGISCGSVAMHERFHCALFGRVLSRCSSFTYMRGCVNWLFLLDKPGVTSIAFLLSFFMEEKQDHALPAILCLPAKKRVREKRSAFVSQKSHWQHHQQQTLTYWWQWLGNTCTMYTGDKRAYTISLSSSVSFTTVNVHVIATVHDNSKCACHCD